MEEDQIAVFLDFDNLAISADTVYPSKERPLSIGPIVDYATTFGNVCIKKAYSDWSNPFSNQYQGMLIEYGFEMVHLPKMTSRGKVPSDVKLTIDAMNNLELLKMIGTFIIGSGDTDFIPLVQHIRARGKRVIVIGFEYNTGRLLKTNCTEYKSLEELIGTPEKDSLSSDLVQVVDGTYGRDLVLRYLRNRDDYGPVLMAQLKNDLLRLDSSFSEKRLGFSSFKKFVESMVGDIVERIEASDNEQPEVNFKELDVAAVDVKTTPIKDKDVKKEINGFLKKNLRYLPSSKRSKCLEILFKELKDKRGLTFREMVDYISDKERQVPKMNLRKIVNTLLIGRAFLSFEEDYSKPLLDRRLRLKDTINGPMALENLYVNRIVEILENRYPDLDKEEIGHILKALNK